MIISTLKILSSGKLVSQKNWSISARCWYLHEKWKREHIFNTKKSSTNWTKYHVFKPSMKLSSPQIQPLSRKTTNLWWQYYLPLRLRFSCCNPLGSEFFFSTASFWPLVPDLFAQISRIIFSAHLLRALNISKYLSSGFPKRYAPSTIYTLLLNLTATFIAN